jgi:hypothetical protein
MLDRIVDHVGNLAQTSPIRPELINITASLESLASITAIASVWNVCTETIRRARKLTATPNLCMKYPPDVTKNCYSSNVLAHYLEFIENNTTQSSYTSVSVGNGEIRGVKWRKDTIIEMFHKYEEERGTISQAKFYKMMPKEVREVKRRECVCPICTRGNLVKTWIKQEQELNHKLCPANCIADDHCICLNRRPLMNLQKELQEEFQPHWDLITKQYKYYRLCKQTLKPGEIMITQDFSFFIKGDKLYQDQNSWFSKSTFGWFIVCVYYRKRENGPLLRRYHTFIGDASQDSKFVQIAWKSMIDNHGLLDNTTKVIIFSDGTAKHFKCCNTLYYFATLKNTTLLQHLEYNFFPTAHGKGPSDMKAAQGKGYCRRALKKGTVFDKETDYLQPLQKMGDDTTTEILTVQIQEASNVVQARTIAGSRKLHHFTFDQNFVIKCKNNALEEDFKIKCIKSASKVKEQDDINEEEKDTNNDEEMSPNQRLYFMQYLDSLCDTSDGETDVDYLPPEDAESEVDIAQYVVEEETNQRRSTRAAVFSQDYREYLQDCLDNDRKIKRRKL